MKSLVLLLFLLILLPLGSSWGNQIDAAAPIHASLVSLGEASIDSDTPMLIAGWFKWAENLWHRGGGRQSWQYSQSEEAKGRSKGFFYYALTGFWHLIAAGCAGAIAGAAAEKKAISVPLKNACAAVSFLIGLVAPIFGFVVAGIAWAILSGTRENNS